MFFKISFPTNLIRLAKVLFYGGQFIMC